MKMEAIRKIDTEKLMGKSLFILGRGSTRDQFVGSLLVAYNQQDKEIAHVTEIDLQDSLEVVEASDVVVYKALDRNDESLAFVGKLLANRERQAIIVLSDEGEPFYNDAKDPGKMLGLFDDIYHIVEREKSVFSLREL